MPSLEQFIIKSKRKQRGENTIPQNSGMGVGHGTYLQGVSPLGKVTGESRSVTFREGALQGGDETCKITEGCIYSAWSM